MGGWGRWKGRLMTMLKKLISMGTPIALVGSLGLTACGRPMVSVQLRMDTASAAQTSALGAPAARIV